MTFSNDLSASSGRSYPLARMMLRRVVTGVVLALLASVLIFAGTEILPGNAAYAVLGRYSSPSALKAVSAQLGLSKPAYVRYLEWLGGVFHGNLGQSLTAHESVSAYISGRFGNTLILAAVTMAVRIPLSVLLGLAAGVRQGRLTDHLICEPALTMIGIPDFVVGSLASGSFWRRTACATACLTRSSGTNAP